jgi:hypothetical protein
MRFTRTAAVTAVVLCGLMLLNCPTRMEIVQPAMSSPVPPHADFVVSPDSGARFRTIQAAVDSAADGDTILVMPGEYYGAVKVTKARRLSLLGVDPATTVIDASGQYAAVELKTDSNRVSGFTIRNADSHGIWVRDGLQFIDHCVVCDNGDRGIYLSAMAGFAHAVIDHCTIADNTGSGIYAARDDSTTVITNSIVAFNQCGIATDRNYGFIQVARNFVLNAGIDFDRVTPGDGNIKGDPMFVDRASRVYRLRRKSPCIGAGSGETNLGAF